jgi:hypothetical protein
MCGVAGSVDDGAVVDLSWSRCNSLAGAGSEDGNEFEREREVTLCLRGLGGVIGCGRFCDTLEMLRWFHRALLGGVCLF